MTSSNFDVLKQAVQNIRKNKESEISESLFELLKQVSNKTPYVSSSVKQETKDLYEAVETMEEVEYKQSLGWKSHKTGALDMRYKLQKKLQDRKKN